MAGRPKRANAGFAPLESAVMDAIWSAGGSLSVRQVLDALNQWRSEPLAYTTVITVMNRLVAKRVLERRGEPRSYLYEAIVKDAAAVAVREVIRVHGDAAVAHLVDQARADPDVMRRLQALLEGDR
ncbi:MAG: BlaI/MecI/CopY family transcriptional regulator [Solirubrobacteraceae bacterium]